MNNTKQYEFEFDPCGQECPAPYVRKLQSDMPEQRLQALIVAELVAMGMKLVRLTPSASAKYQE